MLNRKIKVFGLLPLLLLTSCDSYEEVDYETFKAKVIEREQENIDEMVKATVNGKVTFQGTTYTADNLELSEDMNPMNLTLSDVLIASIISVFSLNEEFLVYKIEPAENLDDFKYFISEDHYKYEEKKSSYVIWDKNLNPTKIYTCEEEVEADLTVKYMYLHVGE